MAHRPTDLQYFFICNVEDGSYGSSRPPNSNNNNYNPGNSYRDQDFVPRNDGYGGYRQPPSQPPNTNGGGNTTVIVQPSNPVIVSDGSNTGYYPGAASSGKFSGGDLALGMLAGAAIGGGLGNELF
jgi:hypothetical protein